MNSEQKRDKVRNYKTDFIVHKTSKKFPFFLNKKLKSVSACKLLQIVIDSPNINWTFYDKLGAIEKS